MESDILYILEEMRDSAIDLAVKDFELGERYPPPWEFTWRTPEDYFQSMWENLFHWAVLDYEIANIKTVYTCGVAATCELGETDVDTWGDVKSLKKEAPCWKECGIQELKFFEGRVMHKGSGRYGV